MQQLIPIVRLELTLILGLLALIVAYKMLTGAINVLGLLDDKVSGGLSPGRVRRLIATVTGAGYCLLLAIEHAERKVTEYPEEAALLGISGGSYMISKGIQKGAEGKKDKE